jgi:DNA-binding transcriptional MerR regulator
VAGASFRSPSSLPSVKQQSNLERKPRPSEASFMRLGQVRRWKTEKAKMMNLMWAADAAAKTNEMGVEVDDGLIRIGEMAKRHGVTLRTLRFYEDEGLLAPRREGTTRLYTRRDIARLKLILLGRKVGFPLRAVKKMIDLYDPSGSNTRQLKYALDKSEKQLARLHLQRKAIDEAIGELNVAMKAVRKMLAERSTETGRNT